MPISVTCEACSTKLRVKDEAAGLKARCPRCRAVVQIPSSNSAHDNNPVTEVLDAQVVGGSEAEFDDADFISADELGDIEALQPCPVCGEMIKPRARFCRYCDEEFERDKSSNSRRSRTSSRSSAPSRPVKHEAGGTDVIVSCDCGATVRVPPERLGRQFACPQCQRGIALTVDGKRLPVHTLGEGDTGGTCQICQTVVTTGEEFVACPECQQVHHGECWAEVGGCGTYGCQQAPMLDKPTPTQRPSSAWGDTKSCPVCRKEIKSVALRCRYCKTDFDTADPLSRRELRAQKRRTEETNQLKVATVLVFGFSLIGCLSPITLLVGLLYLLPRREDVARSGPLFSILMYASLVISTLFALMIAGVLAIQAIAS